jgi:predicted nucleotidyltransferase
MEINQEILNITEAIKAAVHVEQIYLFGSYAYGSPGENSDYDFYILIPDGSLRPIDAASTARRSLSQLDRKTPVDILADYRGRFEDSKKFNALEKKVFLQGVVLYERK